MRNIVPPVSLCQMLKKHSQDYLLSDWDQLGDEARISLLNLLEQINFPELTCLIAQAMHPHAQSNASDGLERISPLRHVVRLPQTATEKKEWEQARNSGRKILDAGRVGAVLVAGGQGSRLGFPHPKGLFPIGPISNRSLFQIFFEQMLALSNRHNTSIPYFIMTSDATHDETEQFLKEHNWFGYPTQDVYLFRQGKLPAIDSQTGKILFSSPGEIAMSPDGHGGMLQAMNKAGLIKEMQNRGIDFLYYHQVDNPSAKLCDATMLGFHTQKQAEMSTKVVCKRSAEEKVGIVAEIDGAQQIIEYSDLDESLAGQSDESGRLRYWAGNIAVHIFNRSILERLTQPGQKLPVHIAHKTVEFRDARGNQVKPETPNAYKFEQFIFDAIPKAVSALVVEADREQEFNPIKNATGEDSPATAKAALSKQAKFLLKQAEIETSPEAIIEISPLVAIEPDDLKGVSLTDQQKQNRILINPDHQQNQ